MRTLKYAILGLLNSQPMTGYDIAKEFSVGARPFSNFWNATHGQIYPELAKLTKENLIVFEVIIQGKALEKKLYSITEAGKKDFMDWHTKDDPLPPTSKDVFRLRAYFTDFLSKEDTIKLFYNEIDKHKLKLKHLEAFMDELDSEKIDPKTSKVNHDYMLVDGALIREKSYIIWLYRCLMNHGEDVPKEYLELKF